MTVLVAIPYWHCAEYIDEAVAAVLSQTYRDLVVLVAGDGEVPPVKRNGDDRLRVVTFPTNEGAPLTQQAMLLGSPFVWYAAHGADDWANPEYLERLMALGGQANASAALWHHHPDGEQVLVRDFAHVEFGVFDAALLRSLGGYGVTKRCGQDTLLYEDILPHVQAPVWTDVPAYHKRIRAGSLTHDPATGFGSAYRIDVVALNLAVVDQCAAMDWQPDLIRAFREAIIPAELRGVLEDRTAAVQAALS